MPIYTSRCLVRLKVCPASNWSCKFGEIVMEAYHCTTRCTLYGWEITSDDLFFLSFCWQSSPLSSSCCGSAPQIRSAHNQPYDRETGDLHVGNAGEEIALSCKYNYICNVHENSRCMSQDQQASPDRAS